MTSGATKYIVAGKELIQIYYWGLVGKWTYLVKNGKTTQENGISFFSEVIQKILYYPSWVTS